MTEQFIQTMTVTQTLFKDLETKVCKDLALQLSLLTPCWFYSVTGLYLNEEKEFVHVYVCAFLYTKNLPPKTKQNKKIPNVSSQDPGNRIKAYA